jgi:hypothetical protein
MEDTKNLIDNIRRSLESTTKGGSQTLTNPLPLPASSTKPSFEKFSDDRPEMRYKTLNSGQKVSMYDSYIPGTDNNERLAQNQSGWEQIINGGIKGSNNLGAVIVGNVGGFVYGLGEWAKTGNFNSVFDNSFTKTVDDWNTKLNYELPNYYTKQEKEAGFFGSLIENPANFIANDILNGVSFTLGTIASEAIWSYVTGGASIPARMGMWGAKIGQMGRLLKGASTVARVGEEAVSAGRFGKAFLGTEKVAEGLANYKGFVYEALDNAVTAGKMSKGLANTLATTGKTINTARFIGTSSGNEASIEAFHFKKEALENFYRDFEELNGRRPTAEESSEMLEKIEGAANNVFAANMAILGVSNLSMLGGMFNLNNPISNLSKTVNQKLFGIGVEKTAGLGGELVFKGIERKAWQKGAGFLYKATSPFIREGLFEEGLQGVATKTANNWIERQYDPKYLNKVTTFSDDAWKAMQEQYGTKEGWKEIGIGGIVGIVGGAFTGEFSEFSRMAKKQEDIVSKGLNAANVTMKTFVSDINAGRMQTMAKVMEAEDRAQVAMTKRDVVGAKLAQNDSMIALAEMYDNPLYGAGGLSQMEKHGMNMIDTTEVSEEEKEEIKKGYKEFIANYKSAKTFANSIIGTQGKIYGSKFEAQDVNRALTYTILQGESSKKMMDTALEDFSALMGKDKADAIRRNEELQSLDRETREQFNSLSKEHSKLESRSEALQKKIQLEQISTKEGRESQLPALQREVIELEKRKQEVTKELEGIANKITTNKKLSNSFKGIDGAPMVDEFISVSDLLAVEKNIDDLEEAYNTLKSINPISAQAAEEHIKTYKKAQQALLDHNTAIKIIASGKFKPKLATGNPFAGVYQKYTKGEIKVDEHTSEFFKTLDRIRNAYDTSFQEDLQEDARAKSKRVLRELSEVEGELTEEQLKDKETAEYNLKGLRDEEFLQEKKESLEKEFANTNDPQRQEELDEELKEIENLLNPKDDTPSVESKNNQKIEELTKQLNQLEEELRNLPKSISNEKSDIEKRRQEDLKNAKIEIPRYFTFNELGGGRGKSGKALSSIESDKNEEIQKDFESKLEDGDKLIEPNGDIYFFKNNKVVKPNGQPRGMADIGAFINGVIIDRTDKINVKYDDELEAKQRPTQQIEEKIIEEIESLKRKINNLQPKTNLSTVEALEARIKDILSLFKTSFVGTQDVDEAVKNRPDQKDIDKYNELKNNPIVRNFEIQTSFDADLISEKDKNLLSEYEELKEKLSQWRIYDNLAEGDQSLADLLDNLAQLRTEVEQQNTISAPNIEEVFQGEDKPFDKAFVADLSINTNFPVTVKRLKGGEYEITHMRPATLLYKMGAENVRVKKTVISIDDVNNLKPGTVIKFTSEGVEKEITIEERSRVRISKKDFDSIPSIKTISSLTSWSFPNVYEIDEKGEWKPIPSDFTDGNITGDSNNLDVEDIVELHVDVENEHNKKLLSEKLTPEELANQVVIYIRKNGVNYGVVKGLTTAVREGGMISADSVGIVNLRNFSGEILKGGVSATVATTKVKYVQLGNPILSLDQEGNIKHQEITSRGLENVVAVGYITDGNLTINGKVDNKKVRKSYLKKLSEKNKGKNIPFVVIKRGKQLIAFPIQLNKISAPRTEELYIILNDTNTTDAQKVTAINNLLLENGIAPKEYNLTSLDEQKIEDIAKRLEANEEFVTAEQLASKEYKLENLQKDAKIALDLENLVVSLPSQKFNFNLKDLEYTDRPDPKPLTIDKAKDTVSKNYEKKGKTTPSNSKKEAPSKSVVEQADAELSTSKTNITRVFEKNKHTFEFNISEVQLRTLSKTNKRLYNKLVNQKSNLKVLPFVKADIITIQKLGVTTFERKIGESEVIEIKDLVDAPKKPSKPKKESKIADAEEIDQDNDVSKEKSASLSFEKSEEDVIEPDEDIVSEKDLDVIATKIFKSRLSVEEYVVQLEDKEEKQIILSDVGYIEKAIDDMTPKTSSKKSSTKSKSTSKVEVTPTGQAKKIRVENLPSYTEEDFGGKQSTYYKLNGLWGYITLDTYKNDVFNSLMSRAQPIMEAKYQAKKELENTANNSEC